MAKHSQRCNAVQDDLARAETKDYGTYSVMLDFDGPVYVRGCPACARIRYRESLR